MESYRNGLIGTIIILIFTVILSNCQSGNTPTNQAVGDLDFQVPADPPRAAYRIEARIDAENDKLEIQEKITFTNTTAAAMGQLAFNIPDVDGGQIDINWSGETLTKAGGFEQNSSGPVLYQLPKTLASGEAIDLQISYRQSIPFGRLLKNRSNIPFTHWYPSLWWGVDSHNDFRVKVELTGDYSVATSGVALEADGWFEGKGIRSFGLVLGNKINTMTGSAGATRVNVLHTEKGSDCARVLLDTAVDVINFYRERFGFYPYPVLTIIPGMSYPAGGYPVATNIVAVHGMERYPERGELHWRWITAHEIGHQYFIEHVLQRENHYWLVIGLGIYADREWMYGRNLGNEKHKNFIDRFVKGVRAGNNTIAVRSSDDRESVGFDFNNVVEHGKGYSIISALDWYLGGDLFLEIYKKIINEYGGKRLDSAEFQRLCESESGQNLNWFFDQWVYSSRFLSYELERQECRAEGEGYLTRISVKNLGELKMPVPVSAYFGDQSEQTKRTSRFLDSQTLEFRSKSPLKEAIIDSNGVLALVVPPPDMNLAGLGKVLRKLPWSQSDPKQALELLNDAIKLGYQEYSGYMKIGFNLFDGQMYDEALQAFGKMCEFSEQDIYKMTGFTWQGHMFDLLGKREEALSRYREALKWEKGQSMRHDQYKIIISREWIEERLNNPFKR